MIFVPNLQEQNLIGKITKIFPHEYALIRLTPTMLHKSIIDASAIVRTILRRGNVIDYDSVYLGPEGKIINEVLILTNHISVHQASFYRPQTKKGDPRLWIYGLKSVVREGDMIFLTVYNEQLIVIPLLNHYFSIDLIKDFFGDSTEEIKRELIDLLSFLNKRGPVLSVSPHQRFPKDVGETLERELLISPNSSVLADFKSQIELKAKINGMKTKDTLFSMVPNWTISEIPSSSSMIQTYGYPSKKYDDYQDLFVTVSSKPNNQGLFLEVDEEQNLLFQYYVNSHGQKKETAVWRLDEIEERLKKKHPETVWVVAEVSLIGEQIHFHYNKAVYTRSPIFSSFLMLISKGAITYDWRGRVKMDGTGYRDRGHCFRISPRFREFLFNESEIIEL